VTLDEALAAERAAQKAYNRKLAEVYRFEAKRSLAASERDMAMRELADAKRKVAELMSGGS